jgi:hypothetical protein
MCAVTHSVDFCFRWLPGAHGNSRCRAIRLTLVYGRFLDGATFVLPNVQLATSLPSIVLPHAFSCHNLIGERVSAGGWKGWDSPSVSCHRVLSVTLNNIASKSFASSTLRNMSRSARWAPRLGRVGPSLMDQPNVVSDASGSRFVTSQFQGLVVTATSSVTPRARMMGAPKIHNACESLGLIANTATTMERPINSPATKLPA